MGPLMKDANWVRQSFLVKKDDLEDVDFQIRTFSTASLKFTDTTPGGNFAINPPPQFTRTADVKAVGRFSGGSGLMSYKGMGRYYSEAIDDNSQIIHMRFGVPQFNSLTTFFTGFYDTGAGQLARTGRSTSAFYVLGRAAGFVVSIMSWRLLAVHLLGVGLRFAMNKPSSKFYYLKPTMPLYWNAVSSMVNQIAVNRGIVPRLGGSDQQSLNNNYMFDKDALMQLHNLLPDVFKEGGGIDVYALANRGQRLARKHRQKMEEVMNQDDNNFDLGARLQAVYKERLTDNRPDYQEYLKKWFSAKPSEPVATASDGTGTVAEQLKMDPASNDGFLDFLKAELDDGGAFASFRVNSTGHVSETFSSSVMESELSNKINSMSSQSRSTNFSFAGGNLDDGVIGKMLGSIATAAKDVASGIMDQLSISGLAALGGSAFVDIPKHWQSSMATLPRGNYNINLVSPYGNPISQLMNLHLPLAMLLAGALPLSTGKQSYTSPFLVELYDQGRCQTRLGMIDSITVTRGTSNLGFNNEGHVMGIDVSFSVIDMSSILHMPINQGFSSSATIKGAEIGGVVGLAGGAVTGGVPGAVVGTTLGTAVGAGVGGAVDTVSNTVKAINGVFDEDTVFSDYMALLAGLGLEDQIYQFRKLKLNLTRTMGEFQKWTSPARWASFVGDTMPARLVSAFYKGTQR